MNTSQSGVDRHDVELMFLYMHSTTFRDFCTPMDELFQNENHGIFNATRMRRHVEQRGVTPITVTLDQPLIDYINGSITIYEDCVSRMTESRRDQPVLVMEIDDERPYVLVDGHHRVMRRWRDGLKDVLAYVIDAESAEPYRMDRETISRELARLMAG